MLTSRRNDDTIRSFHRQLLSEYNPKFGLEKYVSYFEMKAVISKLEKVIEKIHTLQEKQRAEEAKLGIASSSGSSLPTPTGKMLGSPGVSPAALLLAAAAGGTEADAAGANLFGVTPHTAQSIASTLLTVQTDLAAAQDERNALEDRFFKLVQASFATVKDFVRTLDQKALLRLRVVRSKTEDELRTLPKKEMEDAYAALYEIGVYRDLNVAAFSKILEKFLSRCCEDSLETQRKVREADKIISESVVAVPTYNLRESLDSVVSIFSIVHKKSFEEGQDHFRLAVASDVTIRKRIVPVTSAVHFTRKFSHQAPKGRFPIKLLRGSTHPYIGKTIEKMLEIKKTKSQTGKFANGECSVRVDEAVRGDDVFIVQALTANTLKNISLSDAVVELMLMLQCTKLAAARRITAVVPYMAYVRNTYSIAAIAELMVLNGVNHVITCDMQRDQVEGMFGNTPVENVTAKREFTRFIAALLRDEGHNFQNIVFVSPDSEGVGRAKAWADSFMKAADLRTAETFVPLCTAVKRITAGTSQLDVIGNVEGKLCVIVDSVIDEAVNVCEVAKKLAELGATRIFAVATHGVLSGDAKETLVSSPINEVFISDSIDQDHLLQDPRMAKKLRILPLGPLLAEAIQRIHTENSLSTLFEK